MAVWTNGNQVLVRPDFMLLLNLRKRQQMMDMNKCSSDWSVEGGQIDSTYLAD